MKPTVLRTGCQRGVRLEIALVERRHKQKRTAAYYLVRRTILVKPNLSYKK
jgi:hypothetical protein